LGLVGCGAVPFPLTECLLVLRPWSAAKKTPNLRRWQRATLGIAGTFQTGAGLLAKGLLQASREIRSITIGEGVSPGNDGRLRFFDDSDALKWRYPEEQYAQLAFEGKKEEHVIVKSGAPDRYLRVCQWRLGAEQPTGQLVAKLIETAQK